MSQHLPRMGRRGAFALHAAILAVFLGASAVPTPVYPLYQHLWGFPAVTTTVVFSVYALALLASLLVVGRLADHVGTRPVLLVAMAVEVVSMLVFIAAGGVAGLLVARILQGVATGAAMSAAGSALMALETERRRGSAALVNALAAPLGLAFGAAGASVMVEVLPAPTRLCYLVVAAAVVVLAGLLAFAPRPGAPAPGAWASLKPTVSIPASARGAMGLAMPVAGAIWALGGLYLSLGPALARSVTGQDSPLLGGLALLCLYVPAALAIVVLRPLRDRSIMVIAIIALIGGVSAVVAGVVLGSPGAYFAGTVAAGVGFGSGYYAALRAILPLGAPQERTGLLSTIYIICYLSFSLPAVAAGLLVGSMGLRATTLAYGTLLVSVCLPVLAVLLLRAYRQHRRCRGRWGVRP
ncbi:MAG: MFS transporter [Micrococcus sp.]|nr:MFS transporter [Micrococcus sp.]